MFSRKSEGPRMEPWGTPALTRYSCEDFPSRTTRSCLSLGKEEIKPNIWPQITLDLSLWIIINNNNNSINDNNNNSTLF